jgi:hypothetical protein
VDTGDREIAGVVVAAAAVATGGIPADTRTTSRGVAWG